VTADIHPFVQDADNHHAFIGDPVKQDLRSGAEPEAARPDVGNCTAEAWPLCDGLEVVP
jgi:hypothetical protein